MGTIPPKLYEQNSFLKNVPVSLRLKNKQYTIVARLRPADKHRTFAHVILWIT